MIELDYVKGEDTIVEATSTSPWLMRSPLARAAEKRGSGLFFDINEGHGQHRDVIAAYGVSKPKRRSPHPHGNKAADKRKTTEKEPERKKRVGAPRTCKKICIQLLYRFNFSVLGIGNVCNIDLLLGTVSATNAI